MATKKSTSKKKTKSEPSVPGPVTVNLQQPGTATVPKEEMSINDILNAMPQLVRAQLALEPEMTAAQVRNQQALMQGAFSEQMRQMPILAGTQFAQDQAYIPKYSNVYMGALGTAAPQFMPTYTQLGEKVRTGLDMSQDLVGQNVISDLIAGRNLGNLAPEIEQAIRGAQTARGNILGAAPTAQEAFGKGQAAEQLYTKRLATADALQAERLGQAQNFLQGKQPTDLWGALQMARPNTAVNAPVYPTQNYLAESAGLIGTAASSLASYNAASVQAQSATLQAQSSYNTALLGQGQLQQEGQFQSYDRSLDQYLYQEAIKNGLYSTPSLGGGSSGFGAGSMMGGIGSAVGGIAGGVATAGLAAAGTTAGVATGVGAAISAAGAAICWIARRCMGKDWKLWRNYLLTKASPQLREWYIFNGRRAAKGISGEAASRLGAHMREISTA
jgi:hypothetical protein